MRAAMASAPVGDDQYGEDPTVNRLQEEVADRLGKEAALWIPSGTMANQIALRLLTRPGDDVVVSHGSHAVWHEAGASAANAGVQFTELAGPTFTVDEFLSARKPRGHIVYPPTTLVEIENTHNRGGGVVFDQAEVGRVCAAARAHGIASFLDGARLWNASVATGVSLAALAAPFDLVAVSLSKGLGAPGGSLVAGARAVMEPAVRVRRMLGGAMRQAGIFAAAGIHAIEHHLGRLAHDHENARRLAARVAESPRVSIDLATVQTNIVIFHLVDGAPDAEAVVARARERGVLVFAFGPRTVRAVTHLDVSRDACERAAAALVDAVEGN